MITQIEFDKKRRRMTQDEALAKLAKIQATAQPTGIGTNTVNTPVCETCNDIGWIGVIGADGSTKPVDCPARCQAAVDMQRRRYQGKMNSLMRIIERKAPPLQVDLEGYQPRNEDQERAARAIQLFLEDDELGFVALNNYKRSMVFVGQIGSGKTHIASILHNELDARNIEVWYMKFGEMIRRVNDCHDDSVPVTPLQVIHALQYVPVLILDDVGRDNVTDATRDLFFDIIDARYDIDLPTVITTNLTQPQMVSSFGARLGDRLIHTSHWIRLDGNQRDKTGVL